MSPPRPVLVLVACTIPAPVKTSGPPALNTKLPRSLTPPALLAVNAVLIVAVPLAVTLMDRPGGSPRPLAVIGLLTVTLPPPLIVIVFVKPPPPLAVIGPSIVNAPVLLSETTPP